MAGGPIGPYSALPLDDNAWVAPFAGAGSTTDDTNACIVGQASDFSADTEVFSLQFRMPETLPSGTGKLRIISRTSATSGVTALTVKWKSIDDTQDPSTVSWFTEGDTEADITAPGTTNLRESTDVTLDADTIVASETIYMVIEVDDSAHTIAADTALEFWIVWT